MMSQYKAFLLLCLTSAMVSMACGFVSCGFSPSTRILLKAKQAIVARPRALANLKASSGPVRYGELQHCGVLVDDVDKALSFYIDVLCMKDVSHLRPKLDYPGAFIECGMNQIHLMKLPSLDPREGRPEHGGRDRHLAVTVADIDVLASRLTDNGVKYTMSKSGRRALFCRDPYMNAIEFVEDTGIKA